MTESRLVAALVLREVRAFVREPARLIAALLTPALVWAFLASGLGRGEVGVEDYGAYLAPGAVLLIVLFGTVFSAISLIQDRESGLLRGLLVSPAPVRDVILGKAIGGALIATVQAAVLLTLARLTGVIESAVHELIGALLVAGVVAAGVIGAGLALAWRSRSVAGFHGVINLTLAPAWLLSGAVFPPGASAAWFAWVTRLNPVGWARVSMGSILGVESTAVGLAVLATIGTVVFSVGMVVLACWVASKPSRATVEHV